MTLAVQLRFSVTTAHQAHIQVSVTAKSRLIKQRVRAILLGPRLAALAWQACTRQLALVKSRTLRGTSENRRGQSCVSQRK